MGTKKMGAAGAGTGTDAELSRAERKGQAREEAKVEREAARRRRRIRKLGRKVLLYGLGALALAGSGYLFYVNVVAVGVLPPTTIDGHIEALPPARISDRPISIAVQKHILEHWNGATGAPPGIIVQYNCRDCPDLVAKLRALVQRLPERVFLAPYPEMTPRIAVTTRGKIDTMADYDEARILRFVQLNR
jgi:hypothetical protein